MLQLLSRCCWLVVNLAGAAVVLIFAGLQNQSMSKSQKMPTPDELLLPHFHIRPQYLYDPEGEHSFDDLNWSNDPNGPVYFNGMYHYFMQYRTPRTWAHAVSPDLVHWKHVEAPWTDDQKYIERSWTGSASVVEVNDSLNPVQPVLMFTCVSGPESHDPNEQNICFATPEDVTDLNLTTWKLWQDNPAIRMRDEAPKLRPDAQFTATFRDPSSIWTVHNSPNRSFTLSKDLLPDEPGQVLLFSQSAEMEVVSRNWEVAAVPLFDWNAYEGSKKFRGPECVSVFALPNSRGSPVYILKASIQGLSSENLNTSDTARTVDPNFRSDLYYISNSFSGKQYTPSEEYTATMEMLPMDGSSYNNFYASKSFLAPAAGSPRRHVATYSLDLEEQADSPLRRIVWAWSGDMEIADSETLPLPSWSGVNTMPREVQFDNSAKVLTFNPVKEISKAREQQPIASFSGVSPPSQSQMPYMQVQRSGMALQLHIQIPTEFLKGGNRSKIRVLESADKLQGTSIYIQRIEDKDDSIQSAMQVNISSDRTEMCGWRCGLSGLQESKLKVFEDEDVLSLDIYVDMSIIEIFAQRGRSTLTFRTYPRVDDDNPAETFGFSMHSAASRFEAYKMRTVVPRTVNIASKPVPSKQIVLALCGIAVAILICILYMLKRMLMYSMFDAENGVLVPLLGFIPR